MNTEMDSETTPQKGKWLPLALALFEVAEVWTHPRSLEEKEPDEMYYLFF